MIAEWLARIVRCRAGTAAPPAGTPPGTAPPAFGRAHLSQVGNRHGHERGEQGTGATQPLQVGFVVLALYGKVELAIQRKELEERLRELPGVIDVKNFLVSEDDILNAVNDRIEKLKAAGKLEGSRDIHVLVENYIVSLYGFTPTNEMKYMLEREILGIPGVRVVINHIGLNENIPGNLGRTNNKVGK